MIAQLVGWAGDVLRDPQTGINRVRLQMPLAPNESTPPEVSIADQNREAWVARFDLPEEVLKRGPVLMVRQANEYESQYLADDRPRPATLDLAVMVAMVEDNSADGLRHIMNLLRCAHRVLALPLQSIPDTGEPVLTYGPVEIAPGEGGTTWLPPAGPANQVIGGFVIPFRVYDPWTLGY